MAGFAPGDTIDLTGLTETIQDYSGDTLTLTGDQTVTLNLPGPFTTVSFATAPDAGTGTDVFLACFVRGTRIATPDGEVAVEALSEGDSVLLASGDPAPIIWIGHRRLDCRRHPRPEQIGPVRVRARAFGRNLPHCDLLLSPDHAVFVNDVLIPISSTAPRSSSSGTKAWGTSTSSCPATRSCSPRVYRPRAIWISAIVRHSKIDSDPCNCTPILPRAFGKPRAAHRSASPAPN
jgi:hypothetical protein